MTFDLFVAHAVRARRNAATARRWVVSGLAAALLFAPNSPAAAAPSDVSTDDGALAAADQRSIQDLMARYQVRPLNPPQRAPAVNLPAVGSTGTLSLDDYEGRWVVLTFWATWCGYCKRSIPSLNDLHAQREAAGLTVLAVSVDAERDPVAPFVRRHQMNFPSVWDADSQAAAAYRATSIPVSFLVNPRGEVAGVVRGYRDWKELTPMMDELLKLDPPQGLAQPAAPAALPGTAVPNEAIPGGAAHSKAALGGHEAVGRAVATPVAEVSVSPHEPGPGETFYLAVRLRWSGDFDAVRPSPPHVELPEGIEEGPMTASTSSEEGRNVVVYRMALEASKAGTYDLGPVELRYANAASMSADAGPMVERVAGPSLTIAAPLRPAFASPAAIGAASAVLALLAVLVVRRRRAYRQQKVQQQADPRFQTLEHIRRLLLEGDHPSAARLLAEMELDLGAEGETASRLRLQMESARYGAMSPPRHELESSLRRIERKLRGPDPRQGRPQLLLRES